MTPNRRDICIMCEAKASDRPDDECWVASARGAICEHCITIAANRVAREKAAQAGHELGGARG